MVGVSGHTEEPNISELTDVLGSVAGDTAPPPSVIPYAKTLRIARLC
jgi:hypothetical protein